jgi:hypothetical protein
VTALPASPAVSGGKAYEIPEGHAHLTDASDMLDVTTVFFRQGNAAKSQAMPLFFPFRCHAEIVFRVAQLGLHGPVRLPESEASSHELKRALDSRLAAVVEKSNHLALCRTNDGRKAVDLAGLLQHWMIHGKPTKLPKQGTLGTPAPL